MVPGPEKGEEQVSASVPRAVLQSIAPEPEVPFHNPEAEMYLLPVTFIRPVYPVQQCRNTGKQ